MFKSTLLVLFNGALNLHWSADEVTLPTSWNDYQDPRQGKTIPNAAAFDNVSMWEDYILNIT